MPASPLISVVITTYNRSDALLAVLRGLAAQTDRNFEVVVADDGSRAEHQQAVLQAGVSKTLQLTHVWHPDVGFTASRVRNRGVAAARGDYVVLMDGDCVPEVDFIAQHRRLAHAGHFVNGSRVLLSPELTEQVVQDRVSILGRSAGYWLAQRLQGRASKLSHLLRLPDGAYRCHAQFSWKGIRSCNMGVWRSDYERVNGFDESFVGWEMRTPIFYCGCTMRAWFARTGSVPPRYFTCGTAKPPERRSRKTPARCENAPSLPSPSPRWVFRNPASMTMP